MAEYYALLSSLSGLLNAPIVDLSDRIGMPLVSALLLGLLGATSPCQLTTNVSALAWRSAFAYLLGKALVYSLVGGTLILLGLQVQQAVVPAAILIRKALGPLLVLFGLVLLGLIRPNFVVGQGLSDRLQARASRESSADSFLLGIAFAFCPTPTPAPSTTQIPGETPAATPTRTHPTPTPGLPATEVPGATATPKPNGASTATPTHVHPSPTPTSTAYPARAEMPNSNPAQSRP